MNGVETKVHCFDVHEKKKKMADSFISSYPRRSLNLNGSRNAGNLIIYHNSCVAISYKNLITGKHTNLQVLGSTCVNFCATRKCTRRIHCKDEDNGATKTTYSNSLTNKFSPQKIKREVGKDNGNALEIVGETSWKSKVIKSANKNETIRLPLPAVKTTKTATITKAAQQMKSASTEIKHGVLFIEKTKSSVKVTLNERFLRDKKANRAIPRSDDWSSKTEGKKESKQSAEIDKDWQCRSQKGKQLATETEEPEKPVSDINNCPATEKEDKLYIKVILPRIFSETD